MKLNLLSAVVLLSSLFMCVCLVSGTEDELQVPAQANQELDQASSKSEESVVEAALDKASKHKLLGYPHVLGLALNLADAWHILENNENLSANYKNKLTLASADYLDSKKNVLETIGLRLIDRCRESKDVSEWNHWSIFMSQFSPAYLRDLNHDQMIERLNPRFNNELSTRAWNLITQDDIRSQNAFSNGTGFCLLTGYVSPDSSLVQSNHVLMFSRVLYLLSRAFEEGLIDIGVNGDSNLNSWLQLIQLCKHMHNHPLPEEFRIIYEVRQLEYDVFQLKNDSPQDRYRLRTCPNEYPQRLSALKQRVSAILADTKLPYIDNWSEILKYKMDDLKLVYRNTCKN